jgi:hypothetical protein
MMLADLAATSDDNDEDGGKISYHKLTVTQTHCTIRYRDKDPTYILLFSTPTTLTQVLLLFFNRGGPMVICGT